MPKRTPPRVPNPTPSVSWRQAKLMQEASQNAAYAAMRGLSQDVAKAKHELDLREGKFFINGELIPDPALKEQK